MYLNYPFQLKHHYELVICEDNFNQDITVNLDSLENLINKSISDD